MHKQFDPEERKNAASLAKGLPASPGAAVGKIVFDAKEAHEWNERGEKVILVRVETSPEDIEGMVAAQANNTWSDLAKGQSSMVERECK